MLRAILESQTVISQIKVCVNIIGIGLCRPNVRTVIYGTVCAYQLGIRIALYAFPCGFYDGAIKKGWINHFLFSEKPPQPTGTPYTDRWRHMPSPEYLTAGVVLCVYMEASVYPHFFGDHPCVQHQTVHLVGARPASIVGIEKRNARGWNSERVTCFCADQIEHSQGLLL